MPSEFWSSCPDVAHRYRKRMGRWNTSRAHFWAPWVHHGSHGGQCQTQMMKPASPKSQISQTLWGYSRLVNHQILQTSLFHPFVISASHSPQETCEKLCPPMLLSNDDVAWLNWEPDIQAAPEPQKTRSWLCLTQWLMLETQWQTPNVATLCHVQQHLLYHISIHYPSLHSNVEKNGALGPKMVQQNPLLSFQPSYFPRNHVPTMVPAETQVSQGTAQEPGPQPGSVQARTLGLFP